MGIFPSDKYHYCSKRSKLSYKYAHDLHLIYTRIRHNMKKVRYYAVIKEVIRKTDPDGAGVFVEKTPFDTHKSGKNYISDAHYGKYRNRHLSVCHAS